jgi:hypothetical protein
MITSDGKLLVFEDFIVDRNTDGQADVSLALQTTTSSNLISFPPARGNLVVRIDGQEVTVAQGSAEKKRGFFSWLFKTKPPKEMSVLEFFTSMKNSTEELELVLERAAQYEAAILQAKELRQKALVEKLEEGLLVARAETQLVATKKVKYLTEETLVTFYKKCEKGLRLDWLANFTRPLPVEVAAAKREADARGIFDNYAVLHYDPLKKSYAQTLKEKEAERAKKKDPILFGLIRGSRRLYVVADWVDEVCDLTLDQIAAKLGASAVKEIK